MKTKNFLLSGILGIALAGVVLAGCHKSSTTPNTDYTAAEDEANASSAMNDSKNVSDAAMEGNKNFYGPIHAHSVGSLVPTIWWATSKDTTTYKSDTLYINFGPTPVACNDGRYRQGEIIVYWNKISSAPYVWSAYWTPGDTIYMTFKNYAAGNSASNMIGVAGLRSLTNTGLNADTLESWSFSANLKLTYNTGQTATWNSLRTNTLVQPGGTGTPYYYKITGYASGVSRKGIDYTVTIENPLYVTALPSWAGGCKWIESGTVSINVPSYTITINFGNLGTCDDVATATIDGVNYQFTMW